MVQILTVKNQAQKEALCARTGISYSDDLHIIALFENERCIEQGAIFRYAGAKGEILWIDMGDDLDLAEGLGKAVLSIMELRGVENVSLPLRYNKLAEILGFTKADDYYKVSLKGYFCCNCQHK